MRALILALGTLGLSVATPIAAQNETASEATKSAMAAGYKALFTCSATYTANQTLPEINANELNGIYVDYRKLMSELPPAQLNEENQSVSVRFDLELPPRIAVWRRGFGCSLLPVGAGEDLSAWLPRAAQDTRPTTRDTSTALGADVTLTDNTLLLDRLGAPVSFAFDGLTYGEGTRTSAVMIVHKGQIVGEQYDRGIDADTPQRTWSVAKSLTATILGAAIYEGHLGLDTEAVIADFNKGGDPRRAITLRDLINMVSGLESGTRGSRTDRVYFGGASALDIIRARSLEATPGARFKYSNYDTLIAMRALREALGTDSLYHRYPYNAVLNKIGAYRTLLETDWHGDFISSSQVWMTARDMARLGQLYLQDGKWGEEQILPPDWISFATTPDSAQPDGDYGYAGSFWQIGGIDGVPRDAYAGLGNRGQYLIIIPSRELVIVRRGFDVAGQDRFAITRFVRDVVAVFDAAEAERLAAEAAEAAALEAQDD